MENTEQSNDSKIQISSRVDPQIASAIEQFRVEEDRNTSQMIERLLKTHPRIQPILEAETATAAV